MEVKFVRGKIIELYPDDRKVPLGFEFLPHSSSKANDEALPYGHTIQSVVVKAFTEDWKTEVTTDLIDGSPTVSDYLVTVVVKYPASPGAGKYNLLFIITTDQEMQKTFPFVERLEAVSLAA